MKKVLLTYISLLFCVLAWAQNGTTIATLLPYECSFEEGEDLTCWKLNPGTPNAHDKWMIGGATHSDGRRALYVTTDGQNPSYNDHRNVVVAYLRYRFPMAGQYDISFDWRGMGSDISSLYVALCPEMYINDPTQAHYLNSFVSENSMLPRTGTGDPKLPVEPLGDNMDTHLYGGDTWQNVTLTGAGTGTNRYSVNVNPLFASETFVIMFVWENQLNINKGDTTLSSIAIDNVQINSARIKKPVNLNVIPQCEDSTMLVTWESGSPEFDIEYRSVGATSWRKANGLTDGMSGFTRNGSACSYTLTRILEGSYDVRVRAKDGDLITGYVYKNLVLVYCPDNHCINYIDLYDSNRVLCQYGYHPGARDGATPYDSIGIIDKGPDNEESRHTLHVDPTELDPRTDSLLHTVPEGALASVRLGNWKWGGEAEAITYDIQVDTANQGILIVRYAVVFENPQGHPVEDEPAFKLEILKPDGTLIDDLCGQASFTFSTAENDPEHWHMTKDGQVAWKDWTVAGVSLMDYHNQNIKVRFTTLDCGWSGHYAYAYFTVDCANAHIETENCGNDARITAKAPDGFAYDWRNELGPLPDDQRYNQELNVDAGRHTYTCKVSFIEEPGCYFEISTVSAPRFPVPEYSFERIYGECMSRLKFTNTSHVMNKFEGYEDHTSEPCNDFHWEFKRLSNGVTKETDAHSPIFTCPNEGDSIEVRYTCYIGAAESPCDSTRVDTIVVPSILPKDSTFRVTQCAEEPYQFGDELFIRDTIVNRVFENFAGCDSTVTMILRFYRKPDDVYIHDSICSDQSVTINGIKYNQSMVNKEIIMKTTQGCDSVIYLTLTVNERIQTTVDTLSFICADDEELFLTFDIMAGEYDSLGIKFNTPALRDTMIYTKGLSEVRIPYPDTITPGIYQAEVSFYQFCCGTYIQKRDIEIRYRSSIVEQKWNDVLTLLSPKYNGGYQFTAFQWFKDNLPLEGETHSYLYQPLDMNSTYYVLLTRPDGSMMKTCPIQPVYHEQQSSYPTIMPAGQHMPMYMEQAVTIWYYTISGQLYSTFSLPQGYTSLPTPDQKGAYIIKSVDAQGETQAQVMIAE